MVSKQILTTHLVYFTYDIVLPFAYRVEELRVSVDELERKLLVVTQSLNKFEGQYNSTTHECLEMSKAVKDAEREIEELKRNLERLKRELEGEIEEKKKLHEQIILLKKEITDTQHDFTQVGSL